MTDRNGSKPLSDPSPGSTPGDAFGLPQFERLCMVLHRAYGLNFDSNKMNSLRASISERMRDLGLAPNAFDEYIDLIAQADLSAILSIPGTTGNLGSVPSRPTAELRALIDQVTVNETSFFRNREHFEALRAEVLPRLIKRHIEARDFKLRLWSAGCAYGQEPYGLAMTVLEALEAAGQQISAWDVRILATDVSSRALHAAMSGRYKREDLRGLNEAQIERYIHPVLPLKSGPTARPYFEIAQPVRDLVRFAYFNLALPTYPTNKLGNLDLVLCENVTIYLTAEVTQRVIANIFQMLNDGGFLFIGYSETLWQISDAFRLVSSNDTFYYQKPFHSDPKPISHGRYRPMTGPLALDESKKTPIVEAAMRLRPKPASPGDDAVAPPPLARGKLAPGTASLRRLHIPQPAKQSATPVRQSPPRNENSGDLIKQAQQHILGGDFDSASTLLERVLTYEPNNTDALCTMARRAHALAQVADAIRYCQAAIAANPLCEEAYVLLGMIYRQQDDSLSAIRAFQNAVYINIDSIIAHLYLGQIYEKLNDRAQALREYKNALVAVRKHPPDEVIEEWPVELLQRTCEQNVRRLSPTLRPLR